MAPWSTPGPTPRAPITDIATELDYPELADDAREEAADLKPQTDSLGQCRQVHAPRRKTLELGFEQDDGLAVLSVQDTGVGMNADMLGRIFQPFVQADQELDRSPGGLALGLALVKGVVELHGGQVEARSAGFGAGSEFVVRVPATAEPGRAEHQQRSSPPPPRLVLLIEDNQDAAESLRDALELGAHQVEIGFSGPAGLEVARAFNPEVVLCDIGLPGMSGHEVAAALRADERLHSVYLVALSGYALPDDQRKAEEAGFDFRRPLGQTAATRAILNPPVRGRAAGAARKLGPEERLQACT